MSGPSPAWRYYFVLVLLIGITLGTFWQAANCGFVNYDDFDYVTDNPHVRSGLTPTSIAWAFTTMSQCNWHPLTWLSHMADCGLYGLNPIGHHLTNLLLHVANSLLLFLALSRMTKSFWRGAFVAALFAVHPLHVESVVWVAERKDVLSTLFWMLTVLAYARYVENPRARAYLPVVALFALGLMAKPMLVTLPIVLLMLDYWPLNRLKSLPLPLQVGQKLPPLPLQVGRQLPPLPLRERAGVRGILLEKLPLFALSAASCVVTYLAQQRGGAMATFESYPLGVRAANAVVAAVSYIGKMLWPQNLSAFYPHPGVNLPWWLVATCAAALMVGCLLAVALRRKHAYVTIGWFWYLVMLVPVIGLVQVGGQAMADRYTYVPMIGLFIVIAWSVPDTLTRLRIGLAGAVIATLMVCTYAQVGYWQSDLKLWKHAIHATGNNATAQCSLGSAYDDENQPRKAIDHYQEALRIDPNHSETHNNLGLLLFRQGKLHEARRHLLAAVRLKPGNAQAHNNLGLVFAQERQFAEAVRQFEAALKANPELGAAATNLKQARACERRERGLPTP